MTDGADNTQVGDVTLFDTGYFDQDYKLQNIWLGLLWWFIGIFPLIFYQAARPGYTLDNLGAYWWNQSAGEMHAWGVLQYGFGSLFGCLGTFWLLAYIKRDDRLFQKMYYRAIAWVIPLSWVLALWEFIAFMVGGSQLPHIDFYIYDFVYGFVWWVLLGGLEMLAWYLSPKVVQFQRWDEQSWWNYDGPDTWPEQLGEFVNNDM